MGQIFDQLGKIFQGTSFGQKLIYLILILGFVAGFIGVVFWARTPDYGHLYSNLSQKEAAEIVSRLRDNNIPYKLTSNGTAILVPSNMVYEVRMTLAKDGLPMGEVGFELFDEVKFGMSDLAQKVNYRRALQGELAKTISQLDRVEWAKVQIVIPEPSLFIEDEKPSKASVILKTRGGIKLSPSQIAGITHLVSASVEGLSPGNVTITDALGNMLSKIGDSSLAGAATDQLELKRKVEDYYASKALSLVERITGPGKAIVKVSAELDFNNIDEKQIEYDQDNKVPMSQIITSQVNEVPQASGSGDGGQPRASKEKEETETTQYAVSKVERAVSKHSADIKKLTVAVLVDGTYEEEQLEDGTINKEFTPMSKEKLNQIAVITKQALGVNEAPPRNDKFEIQSVRFHVPVPVEIEGDLFEKENKKAFILSVAKNASLGIAALALLVFALKALKKLSSPGGQPGLVTHAPLELDDTIDEEKREAEKVKNQKMAEKRTGLRDNIITETKDDPRTTSNLVRKWLREPG